MMDHNYAACQDRTVASMASTSLRYCLANCGREGPLLWRPSIGWVHRLPGHSE